MERDADNNPIIPSSSREAANVSHPQNDPEDDLPDPDPPCPQSSSSHELIAVSSSAPPLSPAPTTSSSHESIAAIEQPPPLTPILPISSSHKSITASAPPPPHPPPPPTVASLDSSILSDSRKKSKNKGTHNHMPIKMSAREHIRAAYEISENIHMDIIDEMMSRGQQETDKFFSTWNERIFQRDLGIEPCSIEAVLHARGRPATQPTKNRKVIQMEAAVITDAQYLAKIRDSKQPKKPAAKPRNKTKMNVESKIKGTKKATARATKGAKRKLPVEDKSDSTSVSSVCVTDANTSSDLSLRDFEEDEEEEIEPVRKKQRVENEELGDKNVTIQEIVERELQKKVEDKGEVPKGTKKGNSKGNTEIIAIEDADIGKYVAVYFSDPKPKYYWAKILKVFSNDASDPNDKVEVEYLRQHTLSSNPADRAWIEKTVQKEIEIVDTKLVLYGPVCASSSTKGSSLKFPDVLADKALRKMEDYKRHC